jgi:peptide deformylase
MAVRPIVQLGDPILRKRAHKVTTFDRAFQTLVDDMVETMMDAPGVGLAAPQVGVSQRVIVVRLTDDEESRREYGEQAGMLYVVANPDFIKLSKSKVDGVEACLSLPGWFGEVSRHEEVVLRGQDRFGKPIRIKAKDWLARVFQHEVDHLDGKMYIDIASSTWQDPAPEDDDAARDVGRKQMLPE